jgi:hypothetical protein
MLFYKINLSIKKLKERHKIHWAEYQKLLVKIHTKLIVRRLILGTLKIGTKTDSFILYKLLQKQRISNK